MEFIYHALKFLINKMGWHEFYLYLVHKTLIIPIKKRILSPIFEFLSWIKIVRPKSSC